MLVQESRIDFPVSEGLCKDLWVQHESGKWMLKTSVRKRILDEIGVIERKLHIEVTNVRIIGSICTNLFGDTTDVDVHMSVTRKFANDDAVYEFNKRLWSLYDENEMKIGKHPVQFFVQHNYFRDLGSVGVYSVSQNRWVHGPMIYKKTYNPFDELKTALPVVRRLSHDYTFALSDLEMALRNYVECCQASKTGYAQKSMLNRDKGIFKSQIEDACRTLVQFGDAIKEKRRSSSVNVHSFKDAKKFRESKMWHRADAVAKFMDRYGYTKRCSEIKDIVGSEIRISDSTIYDLIELLGIAC